MGFGVRIQGFGFYILGFEVLRLLRELRLTIRKPGRRVPEAARAAGSVAAMTLRETPSANEALISPNEGPNPKP